jgi:hypothetical protein
MELLESIVHQSPNTEVLDDRPLFHRLDQAIQKGA